MFTRRNAVNSFLRNIYYMFCIQSRILSDVGVHYIVEDYILSSGPLLQHSSLMEKETNQQVESCLGHLTCNGPSNPSFIQRNSGMSMKGTLPTLHLETQSTGRCSVSPKTLQNEGLTQKSKWEF